MDLKAQDVLEQMLEVLLAIQETTQEILGLLEAVLSEDE